MGIFLRMLGAGVELGRAKIEHTLETVGRASEETSSGTFGALNVIVPGNLVLLARARSPRKD